MTRSVPSYPSICIVTILLLLALGSSLSFAFHVTASGATIIYVGTPVEPALLNPQMVLESRLKTQSSDSSGDKFSQPNFDRWAGFGERKQILTRYLFLAPFDSLDASPDSAAVIGFNRAELDTFSHISITSCCLQY